MAGKLSKESNYEGTLTLEVLEGAYRYNKWIAESVLEHISPPLLEVGAGIGNISALLLNNSTLTLSEKDQFFLKHLKKKFKNDNVVVNYFDITKSPQKSEINKYKTLLGINVLEHIEDDISALINMKKTLRKDGKLILLVPAKKVAFNKLDKILGHYRRYEKEELVSKLEQADYEVKVIYFFNILGLLTWIIRDFFTKENIHLTPRQIAMFDIIVPVLKRVEKNIKFPIGISLIVVAQPKK